MRGFRVGYFAAVVVFGVIILGRNCILGMCAAIGHNICYNLNFLPKDRKKTCPYMLFRHFFD
jgi:hypothetical protein